MKKILAAGLIALAVAVVVVPASASAIVPPCNGTMDRLCWVED